jgi:small subunit ribosomal protein S6
MRIYENLFIVKPDATEEEVDGLVDQMSKTVTAAGGTIDKVEKWGKRRLAYRVEKQREGYYVLIQFTAEAVTIHEFERRMRVQDSIIKFLTVRIDETLKRLDKRKKEREKRAHRRPQAAAPQPSLAQEMLGRAAGEGGHALPGAPLPGAPIVAAAPAHPMPAKPVVPDSVLDAPAEGALNTPAEAPAAEPTQPAEAPAAEPTQPAEVKTEE